VQKQFLDKLSKFQQNEQYLRICMELRFQICSTHSLLEHKCDLSKENQLLTPSFAEMLVLKYRPLQNGFNSSALSGKWTSSFNNVQGLRTCYPSVTIYTAMNFEILTPRFREMVTLNYFVNSIEV